jgi:hypothetical protein
LVHLVYCDNAGKKGLHELDLILSGQKTMIIRSAAGRKIPHSRVFAGETLYFMEKGTMKVCATATVSEVKNYVKLANDEIDAVFTENEKALLLTEKQRERWHKKCICLVAFKNAKKIAHPLDFEKQTNMDDWLILDKIEDVLAGTSIPYNYEKSKLQKASTSE